MGDYTKIEWTDATWNPVTGCTKVSAGCKNCYAERDFHRPYPGRDFTDVRTHPERLFQPLRWNRPRRIFVNSMSDLFHERVPFGFIDNIFAVMAFAGHHTFQILTKRPERMQEYFKGNIYSYRVGVVTSRFLKLGMFPTVPFEFPLPNVWLGVSVEDQATAYARVPLLLDREVPAALRFLSYEPAIGLLNVNGCFWAMAQVIYRNWLTTSFSQPTIGWVIAGGESGPRARASHPDWFRSVRDHCKSAGVPFFFKQWGEWVGEKECAGRLL